MNDRRDDCDVVKHVIAVWFRLFVRIAIIHPAPQAQIHEIHFTHEGQSLHEKRKNSDPASKSLVLAGIPGRPVPRY